MDFNILTDIETIEKIYAGEITPHAMCLLLNEKTEKDGKENGWNNKQ